MCACERVFLACRPVGEPHSVAVLFNCQNWPLVHQTPPVALPRAITLRSLHTESEILVRNFRLSFKKIGSGSIFCFFVSVASILIGKDENKKKTEKTHTTISDSVGKDLESEILVWNFCMLKNKYDLTLCQSRLHCLWNFRPKNSDQVRFSAFSYPHTIENAGLKVG